MVDLTQRNIYEESVSKLQSYSTPQRTYRSEQKECRLVDEASSHKANIVIHFLQVKDGNNHVIVLHEWQRLVLLLFMHYFLLIIIR